MPECDYCGSEGLAYELESDKGIVTRCIPCLAIEQAQQNLSRPFDRFVQFADDEFDSVVFDGGGAKLAEAYRLRWAIETAYRVLKHEFMPKSASSMRNQRVFLFNWAILLNNMWMGANVLAAARARDYDPIRETEPLQVKDEKGNYEYTANEMMTALVDDFQPVEIGEVFDLSLKSDIVRRASGMDFRD